MGGRLFSWGKEALTFWDCDLSLENAMKKTTGWLLVLGCLLLIMSCSKNGSKNSASQNSNHNGLPVEPDLSVCSSSHTTAHILPGSGTSTDPFVVCSSDHLKLVGAHKTYVLTAHYVMGRDIDLADGPWTPIAGPFTGVFNGRGKRIMNLNINVSNGDAALFLRLGSGGIIKNLGLEQFQVSASGDSSYRIGPLVATNSGTITHCYAVDSDESLDVLGSTGSEDFVGGLVGYQQSGRILSSYATGDVSGEEGDLDRVGGLVGNQEDDSYIISSYATGNSSDNSGSTNSVGGLVGRQESSHIISSYATGNPQGEIVGGLVGFQVIGHITSSYATGSPTGSAGEQDPVGGLVGWQMGSYIISSYATGHPSGGGGSFDEVGSLVGRSQVVSHIFSSYATGSFIEEMDEVDSLGSLVGHLGANSVVVSSYSFGTADNGQVTGPLPRHITSPNELTQDNSGTAEDNKWSDIAWDFGTDSQRPVLKYVDKYEDHDSDNNKNSLDIPVCLSETGRTAFLPPLSIQCGTTLLPRQSR